MDTAIPRAERAVGPAPRWGWALAPLALLLVAFAWRHVPAAWFTDTDTLADVVVARVASPADLWAQLSLPLTGGYGGLNANFYRPLTMLHFALQRALFGWDPAGWHAWDLGLHLAVLAVHAAVARALGAGRGEAALFVLIAGLHPVAAEVVPAIARNIDLLMSLLVGTALLAVLRGRALAASLLLVLALCSKEPAITAFPLVAGLWWRRHGRRGLGVLVGPWLVLVPLFLGVRSHVLSGVGGYTPDEALDPGGFSAVLDAAGLDALATPWALPLAQVVGDGAVARGAVGAAALGVLAVLAGLAWRRSGDLALVGLGLWALPMGLMGVTATYTRRLLYQPTLGVALLLAALLVRGGPVGRGLAVAVLLLLAPGTPLWRPYRDWDEGARVAQACTEGLEEAYAALAPGPGEEPRVLWLVDRPLRHNLDPRRAKFWQRGRTLNHAMGRYSLQAWLDERHGPGAFEVRSLVATNPRVPMNEPGAVLDEAGALRLPDRGFRRIVAGDAVEVGWGIDDRGERTMVLTPPAGASGDAVLVYGRPAALLRLP